MVPLRAEEPKKALYAASTNPPSIISLGQDGRLVYDTDERGNRVPDFSRCGYAGGDKTIPDTPVRVVVAPASGDSAARIQKAIDVVAGLAPVTNGVRGAVLLLKGRHEVFGGLRLDASGVVLRGQRSGKDGTVLVAAGLDRRTLIRIVGRNDRTNHLGKSWEILDEYVPVGAMSFRVNNASGLKPGDAVTITRRSTQTWIDRLGMTEFGGGQGDFRLRWKPGSRDLVWDRVITQIDADRVTVDAPIMTAIERAIGGGRVEVYSWPRRIGNVGLENVRLESVFDTRNPKDENHSWMAITIENAQDAWVRQVTAEHFAGSMVAIYESGKRVSVEDCVSLAPIIGATRSSQWVR
ncbi:MAG: hypothetical protein DME19_12525 [Verrucomicrobia bacterium]|nr:MAG: hypothetical protein DME19_12525 [Verrucomicrobiota bacterium]